MCLGQFGEGRVLGSWGGGKGLFSNRVLSTLKTLGFYQVLSILYRGILLKLVRYVRHDMVTLFMPRGCDL